MAYSDYIQIYDVRECAGIGTNDNRATQVEKMAEWLNKDFGNLITATVVDNNSVRIVDESVGAGIMWGRFLCGVQTNKRQQAQTVRCTFTTTAVYMCRLKPPHHQAVLQE
jgi:hypothetical protein